MTSARRRSRGSILKRGKTWSIVVECGRDPVTNKRKRQWISGFATKREADRKLTEILNQLDRGLSVDYTKLRLGEYLETWLQNVVSIRNRPRTLEGYAVIVRNHINPVLGSTRLSKLTATDVQRLEAGLLAAGLTPNTVHHVHGCLSKALKDAMRSGALHQNVCQAVQAPSPGIYKVDLPESEEINRILDLAETTQYGPVFLLMAYTGIRRGEAVALKWENVDLDKGVVSIVATAQRHKGNGIVLQPPKSAAGLRGIAVDTGTIDMLRAHRGKQLLHQMELGPAFMDNGLVFPGPQGGLLDPSVLTRNFKKVVRTAGYPKMRLHDLRHGHAAGLIRAGIYPLVVQERLGHASAAFTMQVYGHVSAGMQEEAAIAFAGLMDRPKK